MCVSVSVSSRFVYILYALFHCDCLGFSFSVRLRMLAHCSSCWRSLRAWNHGFLNREWRAIWRDGFTQLIVTCGSVFLVCNETTFTVHSPPQKEQKTLENNRLDLDAAKLKLKRAKTEAARKPVSKLTAGCVRVVLPLHTRFHGVA